MHDEMRFLLNAYLDGELHGTRLQEMEQHLASCKACQEELKDLRRLSEMLHAAPAPEFMPVERFVSNLSHRLPRRQVQNRPAKAASTLWWFAPAGLFGLFLFVRTVFLLTNMITVADLTGLLENTTGWLSVAHQAIWFDTAMNLTAGWMGGAETTLTTLNSLSVLGVNILTGFFWQAAIFLLYCVWLAAWWLRHSPQAVNAAANPSRS